MNSFLKINIVSLFAFLAFPFFSVSQEKLLFLSDTQEPLGVESILFANERNIEAADSLFLRILRQKPSAVFHLGDLVSSGANASSWKRIDAFLDEIKKQQIPFYPVMGNHEYMFNAKKGTKNFKQRFPEQSENLYVKIVDSVAVVMFNSNFSKLKDKEVKEIRTNYNLFMDSLQEDNGVKFIIVGTHYPAFTNSTVISASNEVLFEFVPKYIATPKAVLFLSGHSHNMEIFQEQGKYFCVIGGGGGINQPLKKDDKQQVKEVMKDIERFRFFYFIVQRNADKLNVGACGMFSGDFSEEKCRDLFFLETK